MKSQKTTNTTIKQVVRNWHEIDASSETLGRVASKIAQILRGKHKRDFTPNVDMGDFVVAVNVDKLKFTGRKLEQKKYYRHSGYLGGLKVKKLKDENVARPEFVLRQAVNSMLDEVKFRKGMLARLKMVRGTDHTYAIKK